MIIVPIKDGENIERALKKFKRKTERTGIIKQLRQRNKPQEDDEGCLRAAPPHY